MDNLKSVLLDPVIYLELLSPIADLTSFNILGNFTTGVIYQVTRLHITSGFLP